jgi:hypothetical protein
MPWLGADKCFDGDLVADNPIFDHFVVILLSLSSSHVPFCQTLSHSPLNTSTNILFDKGVQVIPK